MNRPSAGEFGELLGDLLRGLGEPQRFHTHGNAKPPAPFPLGVVAGDRLPWVDEPECVGCNLCQLVCPVPGCIQMVEEPGGKSETWNDRVRDGRGKIPGGIHDP